MAIVWSPGGGRFSFGDLSGAQQSLYEDNPSLAWQRLMGYYSQGNPNFAATTFGRYIQAQMERAQNDYLMQSAQQQTDWANQKSAWEAGAGQRQSQAASALNDYYNQHYRLPLVDYAGRPLAGGSGPDGTSSSSDSTRWTDPRQAPTDLMGDPQYKALYDTWQHSTDAWKAPGEQLTWTRYLEQNPAAAGSLAGQFNQLTSAQRGANPGAFQVRRNLW